MQAAQNAALQKKRIEEAETRTEQAKTRTDQAETRTDQAEARTEQAKTRTEQAETRAEQAETRTEQVEAALQVAVQSADDSRQRISTPAAIVSSGDRITAPTVPIERLTGRQREILRLIAEGQNTKQIADILKVSPKTVEYHRMKLMAGLDLHDVPGLVRYAVRVGLISPEA